MTTTRLNSAIGLLLLQVMLAGCASGIPLAPSPNLYWATGQHPFDDVPEIYRTADTSIIYATDRIPEPDEEVGTAYSYRRSPSLA